MEIPYKMTFKGLLTELQKIKKFFLSAFKIEVDIVSDTMIDDTSVSSDSSSVAIGVSSSTEKCTLDAKAGCSLPKHLKCENFASVTSPIVIASSLTSLTIFGCRKPH